MAIEKYMKRGKPAYRAETVVDGRRVTKRGFETKKDAKKWIARVQILGADEQKSMAFDAVALDWLEAYKVSVAPSTFNKTKSTIGHAIDYFGDKNIYLITAADAQSLANKWSNEYVNCAMMLAYVKAVFRHAKVRPNPFDNIIKPKQKKKGKDVKDLWTIDQLNQFLAACKRDSRQALYPLFRLMAYTGMRRQEVLALKWSDLRGNMLYIHHGVTFDYDNHQVIGDTKTASSERMIAIDDETLAALEDWRPFCGSDRMFPLSINRPYRWMQDIIEREGLPPASPHMLRHLHCTVLINAGASIKDVQERLGHSDIETTLAVYAHANKDKQITADLFTKYVNK